MAEGSGRRRDATFTVGTHRPGQHSAGRLIVAPGEIVLESWPVRRRLVRHTDGVVPLVRAQFAPPWWRWGLILHEVGGSYGVAVGQRDVERLRAALDSAEFSINEVTTRLAGFRADVL